MAAPTRPPVSAPLASAAGATEARIFDLINAERLHQGLRALVYNPQLDQMARIQAANMAHFQRMAHTLPGAKLPALTDRAHYVGYTYGRIAENVALGYPNADAVVEGWMNSTGHRHNILDRDVTETGIAIARSSAGGLYFCQVFGRQLTSL
ncbi:MAG: CAP domain-containing protein [Gemmatimonadaceae bacterium]